MVIFIFFVTTMSNTYAYLENNFFSSIAFREIFVMDNTSGVGISADAEVLNDSHIETAIFMYRTGIPVYFSTDNVIKGEEEWYLSIIGFQGDATSFVGFVNILDTNDEILEGIFISENVAKYNSVKDFIGDKVEFMFYDNVYSLYISGVVPVNEDLFLGRAAGHYMYVHSQLLKYPFDYIYIARLVLYDVRQVFEFIERHYSNNYSFISDKEGARHIVQVKSIVSIILATSIFVFFLLFITCMVNCLHYLQRSNNKKNSLLRMLGFSKVDVFVMGLIEGFLIGCLGAIGGLVTSFALNAILAQTNFVIENNIREVFDISLFIIILTILASNFVILLSNVIVLSKGAKTNFLQDMRS